MYGQRISIHQRCSELTRLLGDDAVEIKDAHRLFTQILSEIFGYSAGGVGLGWNLTTFSRKSNDPRDFASLQAFLSSRGPLMQRLVYKLVSDPQSRRFEFSVMDLAPFRSRHNQSEPFLLHRLAPDHSVLYLNAFEFYVFHFAYVLVRPQNHWQAVNWVPGDALYPILLEDYMAYFLPCDGSDVSTSGPAHPFNIRLNSNLPSSLLKKQQASSGPSQQPPFESIHHALSTEKIWRSEVLINVLSLFWLYADEPSPPSSSESFAELNTSGVDKSASSAPFVPSVEHVRAVRMIVKHLHFFVNSAAPNNSTVMDNFKGEIWPMLRRKLYLFLCSSLNNWPLDASFRLILETWLSYIQPWRYTNGAGFENNASSNLNNLYKWHPFIIENNKFYTTIFKSVLSRFFRLDLSCNKNAFMLFRLCKVFDQPGLSEALKDVDTAFKGSDSSFGVTGLKLSLPRGISHRDMAVLVGHTNQNPLNVYGTDQLFDSVFESDFVSSVERLLTDFILPSYGDLKSLQLTLQEESRKRQSDFWKMLFFQKTTPSDTSLVEVDPDETLKTVGYLECIVDQLSSIFDLPLNYKNSLKSLRENAKIKRKVEKSEAAVSPSSFSHEHSFGLPEPISPEVRWKIINGRVKPDVKYTGNPDLTLIRTDEVTFLVRYLYKLSKRVNSRFAKKFDRVYNRKDFLGYLSREILTAPAEYYENEKKSLNIMTPLERQHLPARLVLRSLGSYKALFFIGMFYFIYSVLFRHSVIGSTFNLLFYLFVFVVCKAVYHYAYHTLEKIHSE